METGLIILGVLFACFVLALSVMGCVYTEGLEQTMEKRIGEVGSGNEEEPGNETPVYTPWNEEEGVEGTNESVIEDNNKENENEEPGKESGISEKIKYCLDLGDTNESDECLDVYANNEKDILGCAYIKDNDARSSCIISVARKVMNASICDQLWDEQDKSTCVTYSMSTGMIS